MNTDNDGSSIRLMPLEDLTFNKLNAISNRIAIYKMGSISKIYNIESSQKLNALKKELESFEYSLGYAIISDLISYEDALKRGFSLDNILSATKKYIINQEINPDQKVKALAI